MNAVTTVRVQRVNSIFTRNELRVVTREAHIRDIALRKRIVDSLKAGGKPEDVYRAALAEAEKELYAPF